MKKLLFMCEYNACRSQIAEGLAKHLFPNYEIYSAGLYPGALHEMTIGIMQEIGIDISAQRSKLLDEIQSIYFDKIFILAFPALEPTLKIKTSERIELLMPDPAKVSNDEKEIRIAMRRARDFIKIKLEALKNEKII